MGDSKMRAQVTLEFTIALFCLFIFLAGTAKLFAWFWQTTVTRHEAYEATRIQAADGGTTNEQIDFYTKEDLDIFGED